MKHYPFTEAIVDIVIFPRFFPHHKSQKYENKWKISKIKPKHKQMKLSSISKK